MQILGRWYEDGRVVRLRVDGNQIAGVEEPEASPETQEQLPWVAPGFVDLQLNGYRGQEFSSDALTAERVGEIVDATAPMGVSKFLPTLTTHTLDTLAHGLRVVHEACEQDGGIASRVAGVHLEGPFLSTEDGPRGAHPLANCRRPNWDEFCQLQEAAAGRIRIHTVSPEYEEAFEFIERVADSGVIVSLGHTAATPEQIHRAVDAGATMSTHLGNGSHAVLPRHRNYLWAQMADDRLTAGLIADGHHLPPELLKSIVRAKEPSRCVIVSDLSGYAGLEPGVYESELCDLEILPSGRLVVAGQEELLAGASLPIGVGVANMMDFAGVGLATAVEMASRRPAEMLGLESIRAEVGSRADFVLFDMVPDAESGGTRIIVVQTIIGGETFFCTTSRTKE